MNMNIANYPYYRHYYSVKVSSYSKTKNMTDNINVMVDIDSHIDMNIINIACRLVFCAP